MEYHKNAIAFVILLATILSTLLLAPAEAKHLYPEKTYQDQWCSKYQGQTEVRLVDGTRIDCLTQNYAVEFDFAPKWAECIGQTLHYADLTGKRPACVLIIERKKDWKHYRKLRKSATKHGIKAWYITPHQIKKRPE
ncbi:hypothetical protein [Trichlorobacter lovleyi]|uniref:hypothetical protein n=1 Tax=Trichlorobacter lovleyi TaxID=313985 RepID=UPI003D0DC7BB